MPSRTSAKRVGAGQQGNGLFAERCPGLWLREFTVKRGGEVTIICTNLDKVEDLNISMAIATISTSSSIPVRLVGDLQGRSAWRVVAVLHALLPPLHLEMRTRMMVEA